MVFLLFQHSAPSLLSISMELLCELKVKSSFSENLINIHGSNQVAFPW